MKIRSDQLEVERASSSQGDPPRKRGKKRERPRDESASSGGSSLRRQGSVSINRGELAWLELSKLLDDTPIELGLRMWLNDLWLQNPALVNQVHIFGSRFFINMDAGRGRACHYDRVRRWTSNVDLFSKDFIIVLINERLCQYLGIICFPKYALEPPFSQLHAQSAGVTDTPSTTAKKIWILILDPYGGERPRVIRILQEYLQAEAKTRHGKEVDIGPDSKPRGGRVDGKHLLVPFHSNKGDRGIYLLHYLEVFLTNPLEIISLSPDVKPKSKAAGRRYDGLWKMDQVKDKRIIF